jgi:hypothetical protein
VLCHGKTLSGDNSENQSQVALPPFWQKGFFEVLWVFMGEVWVGDLLFLSLFNFSPLRVNFISNLTSVRPRSEIPAGRSSYWSDDIWLVKCQMIMDRTLFTNPCGQNFCFIFNCQAGHFGSKKRLVVLVLLDFPGRGKLDWRKSCRKLCTGDLGRTIHSRLRHLGHNTLVMTWVSNQVKIVGFLTP